MTGLTSNPTIFDQAIKQERRLRRRDPSKVKAGKSGEALFFELAIDDLTRAADLFRPDPRQTDGVDGWVSLEVSPLLAYDTAGTIAAAKSICTPRAGRPNLFIKIPGTPGGLAGDRGIHLRRHSDQRDAAVLARAIRRGGRSLPARHRAADRRGAACPTSASVASVFISRWDVAVAAKVPEALRNHLGIAVADAAYKAYRELLNAPRWQRIFNEGARPQRLLWASTGTKDPAASDDALRRRAGGAIDSEYDARGHAEIARRLHAAFRDR